MDKERCGWHFVQVIFHPMLGPAAAQAFLEPTAWPVGNRPARYALESSYGFSKRRAAARGMVLEITALRSASCRGITLVRPEGSIAHPASHGDGLGALRSLRLRLEPQTG
jgi:hypothetical protein